MGRMGLMTGGAEQATGGEDVLPAAGTDGRKDTMIGQIVTQGFHAMLVGRRQIDIGDFMEPDQVHPALQPADELDNLASVQRLVVQTAETDVLERAPALMGEVVLEQQLHRLADGHGPFGREWASASRWLRGTGSHPESASACP